MMQEISFTAPEYQSDQSFRQIDYRFIGATESGWTIERNGKPYLTLGAGYVPVRTLACGICATDLLRHKLPFALPQITGHEVIGIFENQPVAIEINASHLARGIDARDCVYCQNRLDTHCPDRMTLGIDRLPGGFSPWVLAPIHAIHQLPEGITKNVGALIEPFAAALKAVTDSPPQGGDRVAVLGPRRLGMLIIAALQSYRKHTGLAFDIVAVMRHPQLASLAESLGADSSVILGHDYMSDLAQQFDIVFDTTGSVDGFATANSMAKRIVHIKSTHGQEVMGLKNITSMVINEQGLLGLNEKNIQFLKKKSLCWQGKIQIYISPELEKSSYASMFDNDYELSSDLHKIIDSDFYAFDMALVSSVDEINQLTKALTTQGRSLLRACGSLLLDPESFQEQPIKMLTRISMDTLELATSRCGSFYEAINLLSDQPDMVKSLEKYLISDIRPLSDLPEAFVLAAQSNKSIKLVIDTQ